MRTLSAILIISIISVSGFGQTANPFVPQVNSPGTAANLPGAAVGSAGTFAPTGSMSKARSGHTATLLQNGKVLIAGGDQAAYAGGTTAELYDPATRTFAATGNMTAALAAATATLLADGRVLIVGVPQCCVYYSPASAELYDPSTGTFSAAGGPLNIFGNRFGQTTATLLKSGKVLITGASGYNQTTNFVAELYDPLAGTFTAAGSMAWGHSNPTATLLANGKVLIAEGVCGGNGSNAGGSELYDPASVTFSPTAGNMPSCTGGSTATLLPNGKVLIVGPGVGAEVYDTSTGTFTASAGINAAEGYAATLLPDGTVLISGGDFVAEVDCVGESVSVADAELYDPAAGTFGSAGIMTTPRSAHQSTLLADGTVLMSGGFWETFEGYYTTLASAEIYTPQAPQYFFSGEGAILNSPFFYYLQFPDGNLFGYYGYLSSSILYHVDLGYEAFIPSTADSIYFYDFASGHWWYSSASLFPNLYDFTLGTWIYYFPDTKNPGRYTTNPRSFKNMTTGAIFPM